MALSLVLSQTISGYLRSLLCLVEAASCTALARLNKDTAHDRFTRLLQDRRLDWQTLLSSLVLSITGKLSQGYLILDDTVIDKSFARIIEGLAWVFCSKRNRSVLGLSIVVLAWSNGAITIPLGLKVWRKDSGKSKVDLAIALLQKVQKYPGFKPQFVVFDTWYAASDLLAEIEGLGWVFCTQLKRNRKLNGIPLRQCRRNPYWMAEGLLSGGHRVLVVRHGKKYFATNALNWTKADILSAYRKRWPIETMFRILHNQLGFGHCQARSLAAQSAHLHLCLMAYAVLAQESYLTNRTPYQLRREYRSDPERVDLPISKVIFQSA